MLSSTPDFETATARWWLGPGMDSEHARRRVEAALQALDAGAEDLKRGRRKQLYRLALGDSGDEFLLKLNRYDRPAGSLRRRRGSKARRELAIASALWDRGIETPLPIAAGEAHDAGGLRCCYLLVPWLDGAEDLSRLRSGSGATRSERALLQVELARLVRRLHDVGLLQDDLAPNNFLLAAGDPPRILPIDFERARMRRRIDGRTRRRMLAKLDRHLAGASAADRMRFTLAYVQGDRKQARRLWRHMESAVATQAAREHARLRRHSGEGSRRVERITWGGWRGWAMRDADELVHAEAGTWGPEAQAVPDTLGLLVEPHGALWRCSSRASERVARGLWANAQLLWLRRLGPRPVAIARCDDDRLRLWLARPDAAQTLLQCSESRAARAAAVVLVDRLLAVGRVEPWLSPRKVALCRRPDGSLRAELIDPGAFQRARPVRRSRRRRARRIIEHRLHEVEQILEIAKQSDV